MTLGIRGGVLSGTTLQGEALGSQTTMGVAPVQATGAIVYWTTSDTVTGSSALKGFSPGDESVETVLTPAQYGQAQGTSSQCIGCHSSSPGGEFVAFTTTTYDNDGSASNIVLSWVDLEATSASSASGTLARNGDTQLAGAPSWSHDGATVAYVSTNRICTGRLGNCTPQYQAPADVGSRADLYVVPYAGGAGGAATPLQGASDPSAQEYYPSFSPDDRWIVYNRAPSDTNLYDQPAAEIFVTAADGSGTPTRLAANDPPSCSGVTSPGLTNSWGHWGPTALQANGDTYYWVVFSSKRAASGAPQLYITSIVQSASGALTTHGALYLWNQPATEANHTPAWDAFKVPPIPAPK